MRKILTQIYEIQTRAEAGQMIAAGVDHVGSVILSESDWRRPEIKETIDFVAQTDAKSSLILLFHAREPVLAALEYYQPDIVHFCEILLEAPRDPSAALIPARVCGELVALQAEIRRQFPAMRVMRTIPIPDTSEGRRVPYLELAERFAPVSDFFLTDTLMAGGMHPDAQPVEGFVGITGLTCDWTSAARLVSESPIPVILAGGLSPENVHEGILRVGPAGVDSCTRTNAVDAQGRPVRFQKDPERVKKFVAEARRAAHEF